MNRTTAAVVVVVGLFILWLAVTAKLTKIPDAVKAFGNTLKGAASGAAGGVSAQPQAGPVAPPAPLPPVLSLVPLVPGSGFPAPLRS